MIRNQPFSAAEDCAKGLNPLYWPLPLPRSSYSIVDQDRVLVRVGRRRGAGDDEVGLAGVPDLVHFAGWDDDCVAGADVSLLLADPHATLARGHQVDLLGIAVIVGDGRLARRYSRLGEALP